MAAFQRWESLTFIMLGNENIEYHSCRLHPYINQLWIDSLMQLQLFILAGNAPMYYGDNLTPHSEWNLEDSIVLQLFSFLSLCSPGYSFKSYYSSVSNTEKPWWQSQEQHDFFMWKLLPNLLLRISPLNILLYFFKYMSCYFLAANLY